MNKPLISVVTPVHNSEKFILETIKSVQNQTYENWELILIDDCSKDNSVNIIKEYIKNNERINLIINEKNSGAAISRNKGIKAAKGEFLTFIDADDIWYPKFIENSLNFCLSKNYEFVFSSYKRFDEDLNPLIADFIVPEKVNYKQLLNACPIPCLTAFIDIRRIGKMYMPIMNKRQDWGLWLSILKEVDFAYGLPEPLAIYRMRKNSISRNKLNLIPYVWKLYRDVEKLSILRSSYLLCRWALISFKKYYINI
ncbi:glycosyltransferase family 2 protein [Arenibacter sp. 6A1]|uniref:glycosyltransferase family 2 protein n=1 Tax=Arenibacter sp. 6A1 TaxID=2720391 RepID=UPI0014473BDF|nr:glycosyltransferase family 2 protein [Arenibacter sp. 6A1]NKI25228.1 glycosyltransferase family 2 protein [Arenibacter sp. 6A1]